MTWGIGLGLAMLLAGSFEGVFMIVRYWGHTVGAKDGGPGLPFVNWSTAHGDLRVGALLRAARGAGVCGGGVG